MSDLVFSIRQAVEGDVVSALSMMQDLGYLNLDEEDFKYIFKATLDHQDTLIFIAEDAKGQALGLMTVSHRPQLRLTGKIVSIDELVVIAEARGLGVGGALLDEAKSFAKKLGAHRVELQTKRSRESYRREFYVKHGFTEVNSAVLRMEKSLCDE